MARPTSLLGLTLVNVLKHAALCIGLTSAQSMAQASPSPQGAYISTHSLQGHVSVKSWKTLRDAGIDKQDLDFSCGAASLATLLNNQYGQNVTEEALLKAMDKGDDRASFEDMARAFPPAGSNSRV